jgi:hypothetical protein
MAFNNGPRLVTQGLNLLVDAGDPTSYPGTGTTWRDVIGGQNGTITGSVSYSSAYYGGLVFSGPTASVIFPTSSANFGTGSFTVEIAFQPARIEGIHYLISKNSGSFPNWGVYLSGSGGSGKLFSFFNISSTVSCSVSSSSTFVTGSNYDVNVRVIPASSGSGFYVDGVSIGGGTGNGGGSLTSTGSLLIGNIATSSLQSFSGSLFNTKIYSINSLAQPSQNYNAIAPRLSKPPLIASAPVFELLVVAGGGGGGGYSSGGGGAGGLQYVTSFTPTLGTSQVVVGSGGLSIGSGFGGTGAPGQNSSFINTVSLGGGGGGTAATVGGSGGGGSSTGGSLSGALGTTGQGNRGGDGNNGGAGGGGGGAGSIGANGAASVGGTGGSGSYIASFAAIGGSPAGWFAGGGAGLSANSIDSGLGGIGGGGNAMRSGSKNTGGGSGGNFDTPILGGSGIVSIRYNGPPIAVGGEITQSAGFTYHVYRTVGTSSFTIF